MKIATILLAPLFAASYVLAHGTPTSVTIGGKTFTLQGNKNPIMPVSGGGSPTLGVNNEALTCGLNAKSAPNVVDVNPGQTISIQWANGAWPHNTGPLMSYLGECVGGDCTKSDHKATKWFKIGQQGKEPGQKTWIQQRIMDGHPANITIPGDLDGGEYFLRHEIIALHRLDQHNKLVPEFYPGCIQLRVGGNGNGRPNDADLLSFPGAYKSDDEGLTKNPYYDFNYDFPGGRIAPLNGGGSPQAGPSSPTDPPSTSTSRKPPSSSTGPGNLNVESPSTSLPSSSGTPPKVCKTKKPKPSSSLPPDSNPTDPSSPTPTTSATYNRERLGHIMRRRAGNEMGLH